MKEDFLAESTFKFAVEAIQLSEKLYLKHEYILSRQFGRSSTSIGANVREAKYAQSKRDFISKLTIALKEAYESNYWMDLLIHLNYIDNSCYQNLTDQCGKIRATLISSIKTAKQNLAKDTQPPS